MRDSGCHPIVILGTYKIWLLPFSTGYKIMSNISALDAAPVGGMSTPAKASKLSGHKTNPWFNVLALAVVIVGVIYAGYHLADDLSVVRDTRVYPYILLGVALLIALG